jgi:hypothetical protein
MGKLPSSGRRTRHINIQYLLVKDRITSGKVKIKDRPTQQDMMADFLTKPLQGSLFTKMWDGIVMNVNPQRYDYAHEDCRSVLNAADRQDITSETPGAEEGWVTVESKKNGHAERMKSHVKAAYYERKGVTHERTG